MISHTVSGHNRLIEEFFAGNTKLEEACKTCRSCSQRIIKQFQLKMEHPDLSARIVCLERFRILSTQCGDVELSRIYQKYVSDYASQDNLILASRLGYINLVKVFHETGEISLKFRTKTNALTLLEWARKDNYQDLVDYYTAKNLH